MAQARLKPVVSEEGRREEQDRLARSLGWKRGRKLSKKQARVANSKKPSLIERGEVLY
jgi:hypothetical protein